MGSIWTDSRLYWAEVTLCLITRQSCTVQHTLICHAYSHTFSCWRAFPTKTSFEMLSNKCKKALLFPHFAVMSSKMRAKHLKYNSNADLHCLFYIRVKIVLIYHGCRNVASKKKQDYGDSTLKMIRKITAVLWSRSYSGFECSSSVGV